MSFSIQSAADIAQGLQSKTHRSPEALKSAVRPQYLDIQREECLYQQILMRSALSRNVENCMLPQVYFPRSLVTRRCCLHLSNVPESSSSSGRTFHQCQDQVSSLESCSLNLLSSGIMSAQSVRFSMLDSCNMLLNQALIPTARCSTAGFWKMCA